MMWIVRDLLGLGIATPVGAALALFSVMFFDYFFLLPRHYLRRAINGPAMASKEPVPSGLLVIPSLLRGTDELDAIKTTLANVLQNDYPGDLHVVVSIDGFSDAPPLFADLRAWVGARQAGLPAGVSLYITGTPHRRGKPLAIEHAFGHVKSLVAAGAIEEFPRIYFSTDADADLGPHALEHLARRLCKPNFFTGNPGRAVAGNLHVRGNSFWRGWRHFFTEEGQLSLQVAREYLVSNIARYNLRPFPISGITGVLYCTWTDILLEGPRYMGFMRTLNVRDWLGWWLGFAPPRFSESNVAPIPELLAGDTDDTVGAFLAIASRWENGRLTLDAPRTPVHALYYLLRSFFFDRALRYEPEARVYTSSPSTVGSLWRQRMRWNAARIEVVGRFSASYRYHWDLGMACVGAVGLMLKCLCFGVFSYVTAPLALAKGGFALPIALGISLQIAFYGVSTVMALLLDDAFRKNWRLLLALPCAVIYVPVYGFWAGAIGVLKDVLFFGNCTKFAPESTLIKGDSTRVALLARVRRVVVLAVRSAIYGDVPLGAFWLGWGETPWTPSGYLGWTSGKRPGLYERLRFGANVVASGEVAPSIAGLREAVTPATSLPVPVLAEGAAATVRRPVLRAVPGTGAPRRPASTFAVPPSAAARRAA